MNFIGNLLKLDFLNGWRFYAAAGLYVAVYVAGASGVPIDQFGFDLTPDDPATVIPDIGTAAIFMLGVLGIYEKTKKAAAAETRREDK